MEMMSLSKLFAARRTKEDCAEVRYELLRV